MFDKTAINSRIKNMFTLDEEEIAGLKFFAIVVGIVICIIGFILMAVRLDEKDKPTIPIEPKIVQVKLVNEHEFDHFSIRIPGEDDSLPGIYLGKTAVIKEDVPEGQPMWAELQQSKSENGETFYVKGSIIHVRSAKDINGASWQKRQNKRLIEEKTNVIAAE